MKKITHKWVVTLLTLLVTLLFSVRASSQTTIFDADFVNTTGDNAWTTTVSAGSTWTYNATNDYVQVGLPYVNNSATDYISRSIDFTGYSSLTLDIDIFIDTESGWDGVQVQYSLAGGGWIVLGTAASGFYNDTDVDAIANNTDGWSGNIGSLGAFATRSIDLSAFDAAFDGESDVRFRVVFASDGSITDQGAAFDNVVIQGVASTPQPEIDITGLGNSISNGDLAPDTADDTDFGSISTGSSNANTFTILNTGTDDLVLNGAPIVDITGAGSTQFSVTTLPTTPVTAGGSTTFVITYAPTVGGTHNATVSIDNDDGDEDPYTFAITGEGIAPAPEIDVRGLGISIANGDGFPDTSDDTDFGALTTGSTNPNTFTIINTGAADLVLNGSPLVDITGAGSSQFSVTTFPTTPVTAGGGSTTFVITYAPTVGGTHNATVSIANNDSDENPYTFSITGSATGPTPEIGLTGNGNNILDGDITPTSSDGTDYGFLLVGSNASQDFIISNSGTGPLTLTGTSPYVTITGAGAGQFTLTAIPSNTVSSSGGSTTFTIRYNPAAAGTHTATVSIANNDSDENPYTFDITGQASTTLTPEIDISGNGVSITDGDNTPDTADDTDFGTANVGNTITKDFTIDNVGSGLLTLSGASPYVNIIGPGAANFTVITAPSQTIPASGSTNFQIIFNPTAAGTFTPTVQVNSDDSDESPYTFDITATAVVSTAPQYTIYYEQFDSSNGGWTATNPGGNSVWTYGTNGVEPGTEGNYWYTDNYDNFADNSNTYVTSPTLDMTGYDDLRLTLDIRYNTDNDTDDGMNIEYSTNNGGSWTVLGSYSATPVENWYNTDDVSALGSGVDGWAGLNNGGAGSGRSDFLRARIDLPAAMHNNANGRLRVRFASDGSTTDNGVNFDNVTIEGNPIVAFSDPSVGPGDVTSNLKLWLKSDVGISDSDGSTVTSWSDEAFDNNAVVGATNAPIYYDNATENINHNPVLDFNNVDDTELKGKGGYYTDEYWVVMQKDGSINASSALEGVVSGRISPDQFGEDGTGLFINPGSIRFFGVDNIVSHMIGSTPSNTSGGDPLSYGRAYASSSDSYDDEVIILNIKLDNSTGETAIFKNGIKIDNDTGNAFDQTFGTIGGVLGYDTVENSVYALGVGRITIGGTPYDSHYNGKMTEFISYSVPNSTLNQLKIQSYLAIKNGVTLHDINSTTATNLGDENYIDSSGNVIWDVAVNSGFNYDIAGIGRDDDSGLNQKQSTSSNPNTMVTMGLTDIYDTNSVNVSTNTNTIPNQNFLMWGNDGASLNAAAPIVVDMSNGISGLSSVVDFVSVERTWKIQETGSVGDVKISVPEASLSATLSPPGDYLMFVSDTPTFSPTSEYRIMSLNGSDLEATYDFDGVKYITFGYAPEYYYERSITFDGTRDYLDAGDALDLSGAFTISAWIKRVNNDYTILSKRDAAYTEGYDLSILPSNHVEFSWFDASSITQDIRSSVEIPENVWHHIAVIYDGTEAVFYIDGIEDVLSREPLSVPDPMGTSQSFLIGAADGLFPTDFYEGTIDEVRVWDIALSEGQLRYIMNQEIEEISNNVNGKIVPQTISKNEVSTIPWGNLGGYFPMNRYTFTNVKDESDNNLVAAIKNLETVDFQTAPIPYNSLTSGGWAAAASWENNTVIELPSTTSIVDASQTIDWNIVITSHDIVASANNTVLHLDIQAGNFEVNNDSKMEVTHYFKLDGTMDLVGESQLVQTDESDFDPASGGSIERDQQGTADTYTYNFWSSPVSLINSSTINHDYRIQNVLRDGTDPLNPGIINFTGGLDGSASPFTLSAYWMFKYVNQANGSAAWSYLGSSGFVSPGEGYTMKGPGTGSVATPQNYVFVGKPNNSTTAQPINIGITAGNDYLVGNPFPSALDANDFIADNTHLDGTLYFWEHWGGGNHIQAQYQGGYAMYNLSGGAPAVSHPLVDQTGAGTKTPQRYVSVGQGFFVKASTTGTIIFNNSQRNFVRETPSTSIFLFGEEVETASETRAAQEDQAILDPDDSFYDEEDTRMKFRIGFTSPFGIHRQLLMTIDQNTTFEYDRGYDAVVSDAPFDDMNWKIGNQKAVIQGVPNIVDQNDYPLHVRLSEGGEITINIDLLENIENPDFDIILWDKLQNTFTYLQDEDFKITLLAGEYTDRFAIVFKANEQEEEEEQEEEDETSEEEQEDQNENDQSEEETSEEEQEDQNENDQSEEESSEEQQDEDETSEETENNENQDDDTTLSIDDQDLNNTINVFYNSDNTSITVSIGNSIEIEHIYLYSLVGQQVKSWKIDSETQFLELPVQDLSAAPYLIQIKSPKGSLSKKLIIH